ncbi:MAG: patatin-like phospholipase family protein [Chitinophagales bacterium]|nr:patatin-like phospholipase family protein [Chitinophagales bacterium]
MQISNFKTFNDQFIAIDPNGRFYVEGVMPTSNGNILINNLSHDFVTFPQNSDQLELVGENTYNKLRPFSFNTDSIFVESELEPTIKIVPYSVYFTRGNTLRNHRLNAEIVPFSGNSNLYVEVVLLVTLRLNPNTVVDLPIMFNRTTNTFQIVQFRESGSVLIEDLSEYFTEQEREGIRFKMHIQNNRIHIKGINNQFLTCTGDRIVGNTQNAFEYEAFGIYRALKPFCDIIYNNDMVYLKSNNNRYWGVQNIEGELLVVNTNIEPETMFVIEYIENSTEPLGHGRAVRFAISDFGAMFGQTSLSGYLYLKSNGQIGVTQDGSLAACVFQINYYKLMRLAYNGERADNYSYASIAGADVLNRGYGFARNQAYISVGPRTGMSALRSYTERLTDRVSRANIATNYGYDKLIESQNVVSPLVPDFITIEGYIHNHPIEGGIPLRNYYNINRRDWMLTALPIDEASCASAQYTYSHVEGFGISIDYCTQKETITKLHLLDSVQDLDFYTITWESLLRIANSVVLDEGQRDILDSAVLDINRNDFEENRSLLSNTRQRLQIKPIWLPSDYLNNPGEPRPVRALVLSGGGAKGCFEVGAIKKLWDDGYRPDIICGVSVGSINAIKLAEMRDDSADRLVALWRTFTNERNRIFYNQHYLKILLKLLDQVGGAAKDTGISAAVGTFLAGPFGLLAGAGIGNELSNLDEKGARFFNYAITLMNSLHSMDPLRQRLVEEVNPSLLYAASESVKLRLCMTDIKTGQFYSVTGPNRNWGEANARMGMVDVEPDHQIGHNWLTYPIYGAQGYAMDLVNAVYASSALPAFMEPMQLKFNDIQVERIGDTNISRLVASLPDGLEELIRITRRISEGDSNLTDGDASEISRIINQYYQHGESYANKLNRYSTDGIRGFESTKTLAFDGGLRDVLPIRTAMRLGATEIICITGDRMHNFNHVYSATSRVHYGGLTNHDFSGINFSNIPLVKHILGLLGIFINEIGRTDILLSLQQVEGANFIKKAMELLPDDRKQEFMNYINKNINEMAKNKYRAFGATTALGGNLEQNNPYSTYGNVKISYIAPDREIIDALAFESGAAVEEGMHLGYEMAKNPIVLTNGL